MCKIEKMQKSRKSRISQKLKNKLAYWGHVIVTAVAIIWTRYDLFWSIENYVPQPNLICFGCAGLLPRAEGRDLSQKFVHFSKWPPEAWV